MKRRAFGASLLAVSGTLLSSTVFAQSSPIRIGTFNPATGPAASLGDPELKAVRLWVRLKNEEGGIGGRKIELIEYDDQSKSAMAVSYMKRLIETDKVDIVVAGGVSGHALAAAPIAESAGVPFIALGSSSRLAEPTRKWVFKISASEALTAHKSLVHMKSRGIKKIGLLSSTSAFGASGQASMRELVKTLDMTLVADEQYGDADKDMTPQLSTIARRDPDAVFIFGIGAGVSIATRNYYQLQVGKPLYISTGNSTQRFLEQAGPGAEGVIMSSNPMAAVQDMPPNDTRRKLIEKLIHEYEKEYKIETSAFAATGLDGILLAFDALRRTGGSTDKEKLRNALETTRGLVLVNGTYTYSPTDHAGLGLDSVYNMQVKNGKYVLLNDSK